MGMTMTLLSEQPEATSGAMTGLLSERRATVDWTGKAQGLERLEGMDIVNLQQSTLGHSLLGEMAKLASYQSIYLAPRMRMRTQVMLKLVVPIATLGVLRRWEKLLLGGLKCH